MEEENDKELTNEELEKYIETQRKICCLEEYYSYRKQLLNEVVKAKGLLKLMQLTISNSSKFKKIMNKYAKQFKNEKDVKNLLSVFEKEDEMLGNKYIASVMNTMELVYKILDIDLFEKDLPALEKWYTFEFDDMILVNDIFIYLKKFDEDFLTETDVLKALNYSIEKYVDCIDNDINYIDTFNSSFPFVRLEKIGKEEKNE